MCKYARSIFLLGGTLEHDQYGNSKNILQSYNKTP